LVYSASRVELVNYVKSTTKNSSIMPPFFIFPPDIKAQAYLFAEVCMS